MTTTTVSMTVNGKQLSADVENRTLLVQYLRESHGLTGTHVGCDTSQCGACTVHVDGLPIKACTILARQVEGKEELQSKVLPTAKSCIRCRKLFAKIMLCSAVFAHPAW